MRRFYESDLEFPTGSVQSQFPTLCRQEKDWSDYFCCLRTLLKGAGYDVASEDTMIYEACVPPAHLPSELMKREDILCKYGMADIKWGVDNKDKHVMSRLKDIINFMKSGYGLMVRLDMGGGQWTVVLGYYDLGITAQDKKFVIYNPYRNEIITMDGEEFQACWFMEQTEIKWCHDYVAIKAKKK